MKTLIKRTLASITFMLLCLTVAQATSPDVIAEEMQSHDESQQKPIHSELNRELHDQEISDQLRRLANDMRELTHDVSEIKLKVSHIERDLDYIKLR